jgi:NAD+ diphosphatase
VQDHNVFAGAFVDRSGERRKDREWLARAAQSDACRFVPVWGDRCLVGGDPPHAILLERDRVDPFIDEDHLIFLGLFHDQPAFAFSIGRDQPAPFEEFGEFQDLRFLGTILPPDEANLAAHARALVLWHASQMFCGVCGTALRPEAGGNTRICMNTGCGRVTFPRVDPAIIVLVADGERCLLGRQEVYEETNVHVGEVRYHSSQPWPFPSSLMIGFVADAVSSQIRLNDAELEDAQWFTRKELRSGFPKLPFKISIARRLVDHWIESGN